MSIIGELLFGTKRTSPPPPARPPQPPAYVPPVPVNPFPEPPPAPFDTADAIRQRRVDEAEYKRLQEEKARLELRFVMESAYQEFIRSAPELADLAADRRDVAAYDVRTKAVAAELRDVDEAIQRAVIGQDYDANARLQHRRDPLMGEYASRLHNRPNIEQSIRYKEVAVSSRFRKAIQDAASPFVASDDTGGTVFNAVDSFITTRLSLLLDSLATPRTPPAARPYNATAVQPLPTSADPRKAPGTVARFPV